MAAVRDIFALLISNRWVNGWQKKWRAQETLPARGRAPQRRHSKAKGAKKKKSPGLRFYERIFSLRVTLWYLIFQRLNFDGTLAAVVTDARGGGADQLRRRGRRKLSKRIGSTKTSAYNQARQRLPVELLQAALAHLRECLLRLVGLRALPECKPRPLDRTRQLLDGSTLSMLSTPELAKAYPPARNRHGPSDWCMMRILVGFCVRSGAVLSAIEGAVQRSEQALAWTLMEQAARFTIWIGDRNFGVWSVVAQALRYRQDALVRMTKARAAKLCAGQPLSSGQVRRVKWSRSRHDQAAPGTTEATVWGWLIYVRLRKQGQWIDLWLFTTLDPEEFPVKLLVQWYGARWQAELHFRSVKTELKMEVLAVCTPSMARKEFYAGLLGYSVVRAVMWKAGQRLDAGIQVISFSQARRVLLDRLLDWGRGLRAAAKGGDPWIRSLLTEVAKHTLPKRSKSRPSEIRKVRHRRMKFPPFTGSRAAARARNLIPKSL